MNWAGLKAAGENDRSQCTILGGKNLRGDVYTQRLERKVKEVELKM